MNDRSVIIITGEEMSSLSNKIFKLKVRPRADHSSILSEFINEHKIKIDNFHINLEFLNLSLN